MSRGHLAKHTAVPTTAGASFANSNSKVVTPKTVA